MRDWKFNHIDFSTYPFYGGDDLGVFWTREKTVVKIWAPTAKIVEFRLFKDGRLGDAYFKTQLQASGNGIWSAILTGDFEGKFYTFRINDGEWLEEIPDIYARCVGINGRRGMIYDPSKTNPSDWHNDKQPVLQNFTDAVIYETHIRDFSISPDSGIRNKGKFLGFTEEGTTSPEGLPTGLSHLISLGITHVHLLPVNDFYTVDEENPSSKYNWGYDPLNFNSLEGSYSTDPYDGTVRIKEFKMLVRALHSAGIGVILDVVYNHTYFTKESAFNKTVPGYFYRQNGDGTFANASLCGNEVATERAMVRKYIVDSLRYWASEFHIDGFRFDLMGIYDKDTMKIIREEMDKSAHGLLLYGEGWTAGESPMTEKHRAVKYNIKELTGIAVFNDDFRGALVGKHSSKKSKGFISGRGLREESVKFGIVGTIEHPQIVYDYVETSGHPWGGSPAQSINYVSCHDNYTLWDKLKMSCPKGGNEELRKMVKLAGALLLTSQGIPFLHSGIEFCRSKGGNGNSYKSPDSVNRIDWRLKNENLDVFEYYKKLIRLRKNHLVFRITQVSQIQKYIDFCLEYKPGMTGYSINGKALGDSWEFVVLIFNGNREEISVNLPDGKYQMIADGNNIKEEGMGGIISGKIMVKGISMTVLVRKGLH
jgi:pullulanase